MKQVLRPDPSWHALPPAECLRQCGSSRAGLSDAESARRRAAVGDNSFEVHPPASGWQILLAQFRGILAILLGIAALASAWAGETTDAIAIFAVLLVNVAIGFVTEFRATRAIEALLRLDVGHARVWRDGGLRDVPAAELAPGDVIELDAGGTVPADARLLESSDLAVDEAALTGESVPANKDAEASLPDATALADRATMVYKTTIAVRGRGRAVVVATGMQTQVGRIGTLTAGVRRGRTPLEVSLEHLGRQLAVAAVAIAALVALLARWQGEPWPAVIRSALALAVAAVPEGLPVVATIALAVGVRRMAKRRALVRRLPAVEALGSATLVCADKTGTLTEGRMSVVTCWLAGREAAADDDGDQPMRDLLLAGALASGFGPEATTDPTEAALLGAARATEAGREQVDRCPAPLATIPFSNARMWMAVLHQTTGGGIRAAVKGAPERILERCTHWISPAGVRPLDDAARRLAHAGNDALARRGLRVLAIAEGDVAAVTPDSIGGLTFRGLAGITDPPAPLVRETIRRFDGAGLRTLMLTGDQPATAAAIARSLGLLERRPDVLTGAEVDALSDEELSRRLARAGAVSRVSPEAKLRVVSALQRSGEIVAMLGDGVNDAAALRQANIGVAMGGRGTDLAKEAADIILQDDRFETIGAAVEEGRVVFANIRRFVFYLFSCNLAELLVFLGAAVAGLPTPLLPLQILWLNLVTDTFPALALAVEPAEPGVMTNPPRPPREAVLPASRAAETIAFALLIAGVSLVAGVWVSRGHPAGHYSTVIFNTLAVAQLFHLGNARGAGPVVRASRALANRWALGAIALVLALQLVASTWRPLAGVLAVVPLSAGEWTALLALALVPAVAGQAAKAIRAPRA